MSYFKERKAWMKACKDSVGVNVERGCPQGSISGPTLWNLCMNELLMELCERYGWVIAYADDLAIVLTANSRMELERLAEECLQIVYAWGMKVGVSVSAEKTVCMLLRGNLDVSGRRVRVRVNGNGGFSVRYVRSVKYLGITVCEKMSFREHVRNLRKKVSSTVGCMRRVLRKEWGMNVKVATTWANCVIAAAVMYGAGVWYEVLDGKTAKVEMNRCMRIVMYACVRVCRTVSTEAMQVLLGWLPWDLECLRRANEFKIKKRLRMGARDVVTNVEILGMNVEGACKIVEHRVYEEWQRRWDACRNGRVTYTFIKNVRFAECTRMFEPSLRVCYILTGHGTLNAWLYERKLAESPLCMCGKAPEDWRHLLCECEMYASFRNLDDMGVYSDNTGMNVSRVLSSSATYESMCAFVERAYKMRERVFREE